MILKVILYTFELWYARPKTMFFVALAIIFGNNVSEAKYSIRGQLYFNKGRSLAIIATYPKEIILVVPDTSRFSLRQIPIIVRDPNSPDTNVTVYPDRTGEFEASMKSKPKPGQILRILINDGPNSLPYFEKVSYGITFSETYFTLHEEDRWNTELGSYSKIRPFPISLKLARPFENGQLSFLEKRLNEALSQAQDGGITASEKVAGICREIKSLGLQPFFQVNEAEIDYLGAFYSCNAADLYLSSSNYDRAISLVEMVGATFPKYSDKGLTSRIDRVKSVCKSALRERSIIDSLYEEAMAFEDLNVRLDTLSVIAERFSTSTYIDKIRAEIERSRLSIQQQLVESEEEQKRESYEKLLNSYSVDQSITFLDIQKNPYTYTGKRAILKMVLDKFDSPTTAIFKLGQYTFYCQFDKPTKIDAPYLVNAIVEVKGTTQLVNALGGVVKVPSLKILNILKD